MTKNKRTKIVLGVYDTANYLKNLSDELTKLGHEVELIDLSPDKFKYTGKKKRHFFNQKYFTSAGLVKYFWILLAVLERIVLLATCLRKYDTFILTGYTSFFHFYELPILKIFKKKIIVISLGSDFRPSFLSGIYQDDDGEFHLQKEYKRLKRQVKKIQLIEKYADEILCNTPTAFLLNGEFISTYDIGIPINPQWRSQDPIKSSESIHILHSPTRKLAKGTKEVRELISQLRGKYDFEYQELIGVPHSVVIEKLRSSHILIDEIYSDTPLGTLGLEALSNDVVVFSTGEYSADIKDDHDLPYLKMCNFGLPGQMKDMVEGALIDYNVAKQRSKTLLEEMIAVWDSRMVARKFMQIIDGKHSFQKQKCENVYMYGIDRSKGIKNIQAIIEHDEAHGSLINAEKKALLRAYIAEKP